MQTTFSMAIAVTLSLGLNSAALLAPASAEVASSTSLAPLKDFGPHLPDAGSDDLAQRPFAALIARYATQEGVPLALAHAVVSIESNYATGVTGRAGEVGLMQIKPATARDMGFNGSTAALYEPETNIRWGMKYLAGARERGGGTTCGTVLKYNAGHFAKRMNKVSRAYCDKVKARIGDA